MKIAVDTNLVLRWVEKQHSQSGEAKHAAAQLLRRQHTLCWFPQNQYEFWVVASRPSSQNGLGLTIQQIQTELVKLTWQLRFHNDTQLLFATWKQLVTTYAVQGKSAHDARIVAAMMNHGISHLLTFNVTDFQRYTGITAFAPVDVLSSPQFP